VNSLHLNKNEEMDEFKAIRLKSDEIFLTDEINENLDFIIISGCMSLIAGG
jgi:hypothetical protein